MAGAGFYASGVYSSLTQSGFTVPGSQSEYVSQVVNDRFGGDHESLIVLFSASHLTVGQTAFEQAELHVLDRLRKEPGVTGVTSYFSTGDDRFVSHNRHQSYALIGLKGTDDEQAAAITALAPLTRSGTLQVQLGGQAALNAEATRYVKQDLERAELVALPITAVLLLIIFRSVAAAALPLAVGIYGVIGALVITRLAAYFTDMSVYVLNLISLLGFGLAIDYSLFIVSRFREELRNNGNDPVRALCRTVSTAGRTVLFSGLTVLIALAGLIVFPVGYLRSMGIGGSAAVLVAALGALFFLPAILAIMETSVNALRVSSLLPRRVRSRSRGPGVWSTICHKVMRRPYLTIVLTLTIILTAGVPFLYIHFTNPDYRILPHGSEARAVGQALTQNFRSGNSLPIQIVVKSDSEFANAKTIGSLYDYVHSVQSLPHIQSVESLVTLTGLDGRTGYQDFYIPPASLAANRTLQQYVRGNYTLVQIMPTTATYDVATENLVKHIRTLPTHGFAVSVGGQTAALVDLIDSVAHRGVYALIIIVVAMLTLFFLMLGSVVIPIKTMILNVLSLSASFGALVWIFQMGHLGWLFGVTAEDGIDATQPVIIFALAFGLSMDYAIFLFSRVKEHFDEHADIEKAIAWGVQRTGGIITSAALLLLVVIAAFASGRIVVMKEVGVGLIVAVLVDVFIIRLLLVPASMKLLDKYNWWAPGPLRRLHQKLGIKETD